MWAGRLIRRGMSEAVPSDRSKLELETRKTKYENGGAAAPGLARCDSSKV